MVSIRYNINGFVLGLVFIFLALKDSAALTQNEGNSMAAAGVMSRSTLVKAEPKKNMSQEIFGVVPNTAEAKKERLRGRKMMEKESVGKDKVKDGGTDGGSSEITTSGANRSVGNGKGKGELKVVRKLRASFKLQTEGFMAFMGAADYHEAQPHPPMNNSGRTIVDVSNKFLGNSKEGLHNESYTNMLRPKPLGTNSGKRSVDLHKSNQLYSKDSEQTADTSRGTLVHSPRSKALVPQEESDAPFQTFQPQKLPAADHHITTTEMVNLMNKDYSGSGNPHHKPPINN